MKTHALRAVKALIFLVVLVFNVAKGNFINVGVVPWFLRNHGVAAGCMVLILSTLVLAFIQLKFYDKLSKSFMNSEKAVANILSASPETMTQRFLCFLVGLLKSDERKVANWKDELNMRYANLLRFLARFVVLVFMVTIIDPFLATAFFRDLKIFKWSQTKIFIVALIIGTMTTLHLSLGVWARN